MPKQRSNQKATLSSKHKQKAPFVCFHCRITTKVLLAPYYQGDIEPRCSRCKKPLAFLGRYFKVPAQSDINQWCKAQLLWQSGWFADGYSASPKTLRDAYKFVQKLNTPSAKPSLQRRHETEERWRRLREKKEHLRRHKAT